MRSTDSLGRRYGRLHLERHRDREPGERIVLADSNVLLVDQHLDHLRKRVVVEGELALEHSTGQAASLLEAPPYLSDDLE